MKKFRTTLIYIYICRAFFLSVSNFSGLWTEFLKMDGICENIRNFWDSAGKFRKNIWTEIGRKRTELSGKWTEIPGTPKSAKGCVASEVDGKNMNGRNFLQNLFGQKFVSIEVPFDAGIVRMSWIRFWCESCCKPSSLWSFTTRFLPCPWWTIVPFVRALAALPRNHSNDFLHSEVRVQFGRMKECFV